MHWVSGPPQVPGATSLRSRLSGSDSRNSSNNREKVNKAKSAYKRPWWPPDAKNAIGQRQIELRLIVPPRNSAVCLRGLRRKLRTCFA